MKLLAPMALIVIAAVCALAGSLWIWAEQTDQASRAREETYLRLGTQGIIERTHTIIVDNSQWDEAVVATDNAYNAKWVESSFGESLDVNQGFDFSVLLDGTDRPVFTWRDGRSVSTSEYEPVRKLMTQVIFDFALGAEIYRIQRAPEQQRPRKRGAGCIEQRTTATLWRCPPASLHKLWSTTVAGGGRLRLFEATDLISRRVHGSTYK